MNRRVVDRMRFRFVWAIFSVALRYLSFARRRFVLPPAGPQAATYLTLIARLPRHITAAIAPVIASLGKSAIDHYFYPTDTIHLTIENLDWIVRDPENLERAREKLQAVVGSSVPIKMVAAGLGVSANTVFVQIFPADETLANLRREIVRLSEDPALSRAVALKGISTSRPSHWLFGNMVFANVVRFAGTVAPTLIREIAGYRRLYFGEFVLDKLELVVTDRLLSAQGTQVRDRFLLQGKPTDTRLH